ncbi:MAG: 3-dehydroquinate synthase [Clostridiales bacterium]|nr:3-dehydroquinate synthase [Clostridiales bacterium]
MSGRVRVNASRRYDVVIDRNVLDEAGERIRAVNSGSVICLVTDDTVDAIYGARVENSLTAAGYRVEKFVIPHGEESKTPENYLKLINFMAGKGLSGGDAAVALGGGVVGDLTGFAAATYRRGIGFIQLPTTLLAAVDSSVGGKTAVDLPGGKNLLGAFYQPELVLCDCETFKTLEKQTFRDGCAEIIKYGMIKDAALFDKLADTSLAGSEEVVMRCVEIKRDVVEADERDTGPRKLLNFGHTVGHAVELLNHYELTHGSAVAVGMAVVTRASVKLGFCGAECRDELIKLIKAYGLPTETNFTAAQLAGAMMADKKRSGRTIDLIIPETIGRCVIRKTPVEELESFVSAGL